MNFIDKKVSVKQAIAILAKSDIQVNEDEGSVILDFLYLMAKNYKKPEDHQNVETSRRNRTLEKTPLNKP